MGCVLGCKDGEDGWSEVVYPAIPLLFFLSPHFPLLPPPLSFLFLPLSPFFFSSLFSFSLPPPPLFSFSLPPPPLFSFYLPPPPLFSFSLFLLLLSSPSLFLLLRTKIGLLCCGHETREVSTRT